jgi:hypothetical protein
MAEQPLVPLRCQQSCERDILMQLQKEADGHYQSADYFSVD